MNDVTLEAYVKAYALRNEVGKGYQAQLKWCVAAFSKHLGRPALLSDLIPDRINEWLYALREEDYSAETRRARRRMLLALAADAARARLIEPLNRDLIAKVRATPKLPDGLTWEEARHVIRTIEKATGKHARWLYYAYRNSGITRANWWTAYLSASWDTGAPADVRLLRFSDIRPDGRVFLLRGKTGKPLRWQLSECTRDAIEVIREPVRELVFPLPGNLNLFRRDAAKILQEICGLRGKTLGGFRSGAGTDAELVHGRGAGSELLGNTPAVFSRHYEIAPVLDRPVPTPRPLKEEEETWPTDHWYGTYAVATRS